MKVDPWAFKTLGGVLCDLANAISEPHFDGRIVSDTLKNQNAGRVSFLVGCYDHCLDCGGRGLACTVGVSRYVGQSFMRIEPDAPSSLQKHLHEIAKQNGLVVSVGDDPPETERSSDDTG